MEQIIKKIREAQRLMSFGYWDAAHDLLDEVIGETNIGAAMTKDEVQIREYTIEFDTQGGSSILGRFLRLLWFPFAWVFTGKARL